MTPHSSQNFLKLYLMLGYINSSNFHKTTKRSTDNNSCKKPTLTQVSTPLKDKTHWKTVSIPYHYFLSSLSTFNPLQTDYPTVPSKLLFMKEKKKRKEERKGRKGRDGGRRKKSKQEITLHALWSPLTKANSHFSTFLTSLNIIRKCYHSLFLKHILLLIFIRLSLLFSFLPLSWPLLLSWPLHNEAL